MKKITILLVIIFTFLFSTTSWGEWIFVTENVDGNKFYYDKDRVRKIGNYIYFLELGDIMKPKKGFSSSIRHIELDCSIFRYKVLKLRGYKNSMGEGDIVGDYTPKDEWRYPPPNSTFEYMYKKICEEHQLRPHPQKWDKVISHPYHSLTPDPNNKVLHSFYKLHIVRDHEQRQSEKTDHNKDKPFL